MSIMLRNLVICLDGTNNKFGSHNTNVVRMYQVLVADDPDQVSYYDPGVGTIWEPGTLSRWSKKLQILFGLAFGLGATRNIMEAYEFLMRNYQPEDRIFVFGFSRGALEARALSALIWRCGLLKRDQISLIPYAVSLFQTAGNHDVVADFKATFSRAPDIHFLGLWDTVTSMGNVFSPIYWPNTTCNPGVRTVRHAIALDERRTFFRQNRWGRLTQGDTQDVVEAWFPGVHCDAGGGYSANEGRLWAITLEWMVREAVAAGLKVDAQRLSKSLADGKDSWMNVPDADTGDHDSMLWYWKIAELLPKPYHSKRPDGSFNPRGWIWPVMQAGLKGRPRTLQSGERVHRSVIQRFVEVCTYRPPSLVKLGLTEPAARQFLNTEEEFWIVQ